MCRFTQGRYAMHVDPQFAERFNFRGIALSDRDAVRIVAGYEKISRRRRAARLTEVSHDEAQLAGQVMDRKYRHIASAAVEIQSAARNHRPLFTLRPKHEQRERQSQLRAIGI